MSARIVRSAASLAMTWALAAASPPQPQQPQLRGGGNSSAAGLRSASAAAPAAHLVWKGDRTMYCLSSDGNRIGDGVKVQLWECDQTWRSSGQNFYLDADGRIRMHADPSYCMVIDGDEYRDGAKIQLWRCDTANKHQIWQIGQSGQIQQANPRRDAEPMCVSIDANKAFNGAKIQVWSCVGAVQDWLKVSLGQGGRFAYAAPNEDKACASPFAPVSRSAEACVDAAEAVRPGSGCYYLTGSLYPWSKVVQTVSEPSWPQGCSFYGACQGGYGLYFNPSGTGGSCPTQGDCMAIDVICQMALP